MAAIFIVEDGTLVAGATSYGTVAEWRQYAQNVGFAEATYPDDTIVKVALNKACIHMEDVFGPRFKGCRVSTSQALSWPRNYVPVPQSYCEYLPNDEIPEKVKQAQFEYAFRAIAGKELDPDTTARDATGMSIEQSSKKVGPIQKVVKYVVGSERALRSYPSADLKLRDFINGGGQEVIRA